MNFQTSSIRQIRKVKLRPEYEYRFFIFTCLWKNVIYRYGLGQWTWTQKSWVFDFSLFLLVDTFVKEKVTGIEALRKKKNPHLKIGSRYHDIIFQIFYRNFEYVFVFSLFATDKRIKLTNTNKHHTMSIGLFVNTYFIRLFTNSSFANKMTSRNFYSRTKWRHLLTHI